METRVEPVQLPCLHSFCGGCVQSLKQAGVKQVCPLCREPIPESSVDFHFNKAVTLCRRADRARDLGETSVAGSLRAEAELEDTRAEIVAVKQLAADDVLANEGLMRDLEEQLREAKTAIGQAERDGGGAVGETNQVAVDHTKLR